MLLTPSRRRPCRSGTSHLTALLVVAALSAAACGTAAVDPAPERAVDPPVTVDRTPPAPTTTAPPVPFRGWVDPESSGRPWTELGASVDGLLTFRGNPTRSWYGTGPMPVGPTPQWRYPDQAMCSDSTVGEETTNWCGTGWTGQPAVFDREGRTWVVFGAYDRAVHFVDAESGAAIIPPFVTGDLIKGSVTIDPDGYPIVYVGSRDNRLRAIAFDGAEPRELWALDARDVSPTLWNDDWDGSPMILHDYLFEGGENSQFHIAKLNRGYDGDGNVTVAPELVFNAPGWDDQLLADIGDSQVSIESSVAVTGNTVYFANSGGLVQGWNIDGLRAGRSPEPVFRFWTGDDTDATVVADEEGMLYVVSELERGTARSAEVGQVFKLDPSRPDDPLVWSLPVQTLGDEDKAGLWATPALHEDLLIVAGHAGELAGVDRETAEVRWKIELPSPLWQSPVVVDDVLVQGDCAGVLHGYDLSDTTVQPRELWQVELGGCIESTPAVWKGRIYVGTRAGFVHAVA